VLYWEFFTSSKGTITERTRLKSWILRTFNLFNFLIFFLNFPCVHSDVHFLFDNRVLYLIYQATIPAPFTRFFAVLLTATFRSVDPTVDSPLVSVL